LELPKDLSRFAALQKIIAELRGPDGCPWDKAQTHQSLRETFMQECYEVLEALDEADVKKLREELGDLLLHIVLQARIAEEAGEFKLSEVIKTINEKLLHRHPHVFGERKVKDVTEIVHNWEELKKEEKGEERSVIAGVPKILPALSYSQEIQHRVAHVGFDWEDDQDVIEKLAEEVGELAKAEDAGRKREEFGDLLFTLANIARRQEIDLEVALREANRKFVRRFQYMEEVCRGRNLDFGKLSFKEQNTLWIEAKQSTGSSPK
jgi:tetrapyrrole methylase family protein/MazG family protein